VVLCPDVAPSRDSRFDCRDLLQRSVIHYGTAKASGMSSSYSCKTDRLQTIGLKRRTSVFGALGPVRTCESNLKMFMVEAVELDIKLQKIANGNYTASSPTRV
jgi:hypothetical protein